MGKLGLHFAGNVRDAALVELLPNSKHQRPRFLWTALFLLPAVSLLLALGAVMAVAGWRDLRTARAHLLAARSSLVATAQNPDILRTSGGRGQARREIDQAMGQINAARHVVGRSPALLVSRFLPLAAQQRHGIDQLVDDSATGALAARHLLDEVDRLADQTKLKDGRIPYAGMGEFETAVRTAGEQVRGLDRSSFWLWGPLGGARDRFDRIASTSRIVCSRPLTPSGRHAPSSVPKATGATSSLCRTTPRCATRGWCSPMRSRG